MNVRLVIAGLVLGVLPTAAMAKHGDEYRRDRYDASDRYESRRYDSGDRHDSRLRYYRVRRCDPPPVVVDDLGDGHHYREHRVYYHVHHGRVYRHHDHRVRHYRAHREDGHDDGYGHAD